MMKEIKELEIKEEFNKLDMALSYWGDQELHDILRKWYNKLVFRKSKIIQRKRKLGVEKRWRSCSDVRCK